MLDLRGKCDIFADSGVKNEPTLFKFIAYLGNEISFAKCSHLTHMLRTQFTDAENNSLDDVNCILIDIRANINPNPGRFCDI